MAAGTLVLVGCGQMGSAMLRGWVAGGAAAQFLVVEPAGAPASLAPSPEIAFHKDAAEIGDGVVPDAVVFAVKPQIIDAVLPAYRRWERSGTLFLSIAAGTTIAKLTRHLGPAARIVRAMPNTPAAIGRAISVACPNANVRPSQRDLCEELLAAIGDSTWVEDEALMDAVTAVSGSGPAYVFLLIEALAEAGVNAGLPAELSMRLAKATVAGSGELARLSAETPTKLRQNVMSPGGTTVAALEVLMEKDGMQSLFDRAVAAATRRSRDLAS